MPRIRRIRGAVRNSLAAILSRNSDFRGYWMLVYLVEDYLPFDEDLLAEPPSPDATDKFDIAISHRCRSTFRDQLHYCGARTRALSVARLKADAAGPGTSASSTRLRFELSVTLSGGIADAHVAHVEVVRVSSAFQARAKDHWGYPLTEMPQNK